MIVRSPMSSKFVATAVFATAVALISPVQAQQRLSLAERVDRLEQSGRSGSGSVDLVNQIQGLQTQVQELQGQVEELKHQLGEAQRRNKDQYIDLDSRIGRIEGGGARGATAPSVSTQDSGLEDIQLGTPPSGSAPSSLTASDTMLAPASGATRVDPLESSASAAPAVSDSASTDPAAEKRAYDEAFAALKDGRYAESARRFQSYIDQYPSSDLTGNAYYWLGESYYVTQNYRVALDTFNTLLSQFPANQKAPDALLKTGYCQYELKQWDAAEKTLTQVGDTYPNTTVARLAQGRLRALKLENRR